MMRILMMMTTMSSIIALDDKEVSEKHYLFNLTHLFTSLGFQIHAPDDNKADSFFLPSPETTQ